VSVTLQQLNDPNQAPLNAMADEGDGEEDRQQGD
jgi:hypothetical protein